ncbi:MAG: RIP metalloprotease RseP [Bacteroidales bacterium]|nr:RIP metalloprotease RseP [Bacteroidales bacterium]MDT8432693.1 RIP metalloprotease RseP [Bacteroidales bacterium]
MIFLVKLGQFLLSLSILIVLHEMGHFILARAFKTRVEKFYLFFDIKFSLFKKKIGETEYGIGWLPLGGYVKISGMIDESMDKEQMAQPPKPYEFRSKKAWQRLLIMLGGVLVNFVLAMVIYVMVFYTWGEKYVPNQNLQYGVMVDSLAGELGLQDGDRVLMLDGETIERWENIPGDIWLNDVQQITVERDGRLVNLEVDDEILPVLSRESVMIVPRIPFVISEVVVDYPAHEAGMKPGDRVVGLNGREIRFYDQFTNAMKNVKDEPISVRAIRDGKEMEFTMTSNEQGLIGVAPRLDTAFLFDVYEEVEIHYSFFQSIPAGLQKGYETTTKYLKSLEKLLKPKKYKAHESLGGFITIGSIFPSTWDWQSFWNLTAFLSIMLAIMNLLPIPALDGGHVMFLLFEIISGRKPGDKFMEYAQLVGMMLLIALLLYANLNDVIGLFNK